MINFHRCPLPPVHGLQCVCVCRRNERVEAGAGGNRSDVKGVWVLVACHAALKPHLFGSQCDLLLWAQGEMPGKLDKPHKSPRSARSFGAAA